MKPIIMLFLSALFARAEQPDLVAVLRSLGYSVSDSGDHYLSPSEGESKARTERLISLRSIKQVPDWPHAYYRFNMSIEEFSNESDAMAFFEQQNNRRLWKVPAQFEKLPGLRGGFQIDRRVYTLGTDSVKFYDEPEVRILDKLHRMLTGSPYRQFLNDEEIVSLAEAMPANKYNFAPNAPEVKNSRTFGLLIRHIAAVNYEVTAALMGEKNPTEMGSSDNGPDSLDNKEAILKYLKDSFAYSHRSLDGKTWEFSQFSEGEVKSPFSGIMAPRSVLEMIGRRHSLEHYAQARLYARMNGVPLPVPRK